MHIHVEGEELILSSKKAVFWPKNKLLMVSDLHLGKVSHFRKNGISVPTEARFSNLIQLELLIDEFAPETVLFLGDLFHSDYNLEWEEFGRFLQKFSTIRFVLVEGNHDRLAPHQYQKFGIEVVVGSLAIPPFIFTHIPVDEPPVNGYVISGHIHPGVVLKGKGKQRLRLPCFFFSPRQAILPAFGDFTGKYTLEPTQKDRVFVIAGTAIKDMSPQPK